jgi:hypothetical protein
MPIRMRAVTIAAAFLMIAGSAWAQQASNNTRAERLASVLFNVEPPQQMLAALDTADRKYNSPGCREARKHAQAYEDRTAPRAALAIGVGVALALVGSPVIVVPGAGAEGMRRLRLSRALVHHCVSNVPQIEAALEELKKRREIEVQNRMTTQY